MNNIFNNSKFADFEYEIYRYKFDHIFHRSKRLKSKSKLNSIVNEFYMFLPFRTITSTLTNKNKSVLNSEYLLYRADGTGFLP